MSDVDARAREILDSFRGKAPMWASERMELQTSIAAALRSLIPPAGHVTLSDGRVAIVVGLLPMTADGCVIGAGLHKLWYPGEDRPRTGGASDCGAWINGTFKRTWECYSTREAAQGKGE